MSSTYGFLSSFLYKYSQHPDKWDRISTNFASNASRAIHQCSCNATGSVISLRLGTGSTAVSSLEFYLEILIVRCGRSAQDLALQSWHEVMRFSVQLVFGPNLWYLPPFLTYYGYSFTQPILKRPCTCFHKTQILPATARSPKLITLINIYNDP